MLFSLTMRKNQISVAKYNSVHRDHTQYDHSKFTLKSPTLHNVQNQFRYTNIVQVYTDYDIFLLQIFIPTMD